MLPWLQEHTALLSTLVGLSIIVFVGSLIATPLIIARIPADYFAHSKRPPARWTAQHRATRVVLVILKNTLGVLLMLVGIAMLLTPGQGLLTLLVGFLLIDFPGKYRAEQWLLSRRQILRLVNWIRSRRHKPPMARRATDFANRSDSKR